MTMSTATCLTTIRRATTADRAAVHRFFTRLSGRSLQQRFLGPGARITEPLLDLLMAEGVAGAATIALDGVTVVGHAMWSPVRGHPRRADVGVVVADELQGRGIGLRLTEAAVDDAADHGIDEVELTVLTDNERARSLIRRRWRAVAGTPLDGEIEFVVSVRGVDGMVSGRQWW